MERISRSACLEALRDFSSEFAFMGCRILLLEDVEEDGMSLCMFPDFVEGRCYQFRVSGFIVDSVARISFCGYDKSPKGFKQKSGEYRTMEGFRRRLDSLRNWAWSFFI